MSIGQVDTIVRIVRRRLMALYEEHGWPSAQMPHISAGLVRIIIEEYHNTGGSQAGKGTG